MASKQPVFVEKGLVFTWYEPESGVLDSGGLGMSFKRAKKTRSFFALLPPEQVTELHAFLGEQLKKCMVAKGVKGVKTC